MRPEGKLAMMEEEGFNASSLSSQVDGEQPQPDGEPATCPLPRVYCGGGQRGRVCGGEAYTSHMSGIVSAMADATAVQDLGWLAAGTSALVAFLAGAACTAILVNWGRRRELNSEYALPLMVEAGLLLCFGLTGTHLERHEWFVLPATVALLCFTMGLQNAIITKISQAEIRTTHLTGMVTDIGIELGKAMYWNRRDSEVAVQADMDKLWLLISLVGLFFIGGVVGAVGFKHVGFIATLPLALVLLMLAVVPVVDDLRERGMGTP
jgi:uncharacterized membrane protein YoaK (UPF0700 family)